MLSCLKKVKLTFFENEKVKLTFFENEKSETHFHPYENSELYRDAKTVFYGVF